MKETKSVIFRMDSDEYKKLRIQLLKEGISFQQYIISLIKKDGKVEL